MERQTIIFTGPTGTEKKTVMKQVIKQFLHCKGIDLSPDDPGVKGYIKKFSLEEEIANRANTNLPTFLTNAKRGDQERFYRDAMTDLIKKVNSVGSEVHVFIEMHACYFRGHNRMSFWRFSDIEALHPSCLITLLDDAYSIWYHVNREREETGSYLRLEDILEWRAIEVLLAERIVDSLSISHFVVPVKHPVQTLYYLIFERNQRPLVYAAYPVSESRKSIEGQREINSHRYKLYQDGSIIFDPITIDERALLFAYIRNFGMDTKKETVKRPRRTWFQLLLKDRWSYIIEKFPPMVPDPPNIFPLELYAEETYSVLRAPFVEHRKEPSRVDAHIQDRDFRYIRAVAAEEGSMVAYRPYYKRTKSIGVCGEIVYAKGLMPIVVFHPDQDRRVGHPMENEIVGLPVYRKLSDFYKYIKRKKEERDD